MREIVAMAPETSEPALDRVGNYDLVEKIAEGGMGTVYKGRHRTTGAYVAIKLLATHMKNNPTYLQRFQKEYTTAKALDHPNIVRALEQSFEGDRPYLVMEYVDGESLGQRLERSGRLPEEEAIRIIVLAAQGLERAHKQGLIHRDVKPDNIMLTRDGGVKLADLGLVKEMDGDLNLTRTGRGLGTPHFMAPEQFRNAKHADVRCDVYSLGATLYMMVTGQMPFAALPPLEAWMKKVNNDLSAPRKLVASVSERTNWAIRRAMDPNPEKRPRSCKEFVEDLTGSKPIPAQTAEPATKEPWWYLQYIDEEGKPHLVKGRMSGIRRSVKEGRLGDVTKVLVCRTKTGAYGPLRSYPEFRDLVGSSRHEMSNTPHNVPSSPTDSGLGGSGELSSSGESRPIQMPHIPLETAPSHTVEWVTMTLLVLGAVAIGIVTALMFPK
jgi:serine/threonine protein kinase